MADAAEEKEETDESSDDYDDASANGSDFASAIGEALPDIQWTPDRIAAMKQAIRICVDSDYDEEEKPAKGSLALIFGSKPKKG